MKNLIFLLILTVSISCGVGGSSSSIASNNSTPSNNTQQQNSQPVSITYKTVPENIGIFD